jgi:PAS domain-containing protein
LRSPSDTLWKGGTLRFRYLATAAFASILLIAFAHAVNGWVAPALSQIAEILLFLEPIAVAAGALAAVCLFVRVGVVSYNSTTASKLVERELRTSEHTFAKAFRGNPVCMAIVTIEGGRYMDVNEGYEHLTGYRVAGHRAHRKGDRVLGRSIRARHHAVNARARWPSPRHRSPIPQEMR